MSEVHELVRRAQFGDANAFSQLFFQYYDRVSKYLRWRIYDQQTAEDLTGEVFFRMVDKLPAYRFTSAPFEAWLFTIARNLVIEHFRKLQKNSSISLDGIEQLAVRDKSPDTLVEEKLTQERVQKALSHLEPSQQEVVRLRFLMGMSLQEVADMMNKTVPAIKALQHRGLQELRKNLEES